MASNHYCVTEVAAHRLLTHPRVMLTFEPTAFYLKLSVLVADRMHCVTEVAARRICTHPSCPTECALFLALAGANLVPRRQFAAFAQSFNLHAGRNLVIISMVHMPRCRRLRILRRPLRRNGSPVCAVVALRGSRL